MTSRLLVLIIAVMLCVGAQGAPLPSKGTPADLKSILERYEKFPLQIYLAHGQSDECGPGCNEWIAVDGTFDPDAAARFRKVLNRLGKRNLPIYFNSGGGVVQQALAIGRMLRQRRITAGVAATLPEGCAGNVVPEACAALKRSGDTLNATWRGRGTCASACVYAVIGATEKLIPPGSALGVHSGRTICVSRDRHTVLVAGATSRCKNHDAQTASEVRRYLREMGVADGLFEAIAQVPFESIRFLNRDEIARFGIDRREFVETRWLPNADNPPTEIDKYLDEAKGRNNDEFRVGVVRLACVRGGKLIVSYLRGLPDGDVNAGAIVRLSTGDQHLTFLSPSAPQKIDAIDREGQFAAHVAFAPLAFMDASAAAESIQLSETTKEGEGPAVTRVLRLSTEGLANAWSALRPHCAGGA